jgi:hypothetical protein
VGWTIRKISPQTKTVLHHRMGIDKDKLQVCRLPPLTHVLGRLLFYYIMSRGGGGVDEVLTDLSAC